MDLYFWNLFCKTHDVLYLNNFTNDAKKLLHDFINKNKHVKFQGLYKILYNYFNPSLYNHVDILSSIMSVLHMKSEKYDKNIYIFGELHGINSNCFTFTKNIENVGQFIINNIKISDKFIDFFFELPFIKSKELEPNLELKSSSSTTLNMIENAFPGCFDLYKIDKCDYQNIRFHFANIRYQQSIDIYKNPTFLQVFSNLLIAPILHEYNNYEDFRELYKWFGYKLQSTYPTEYETYKNIGNMKDFIKFILTEYKQLLYKQQENIPFPEVKEILLETLFNNIENEKISFKDTLQLSHIKSIVDNLPFSYKSINNREENIDMLVNICNAWLNLDVHFMDLYLMSRIFRTFKYREYTNSNSCKNIIIFVGNDHARNYKKVLEKLHFKTLFYNENKKLEIFTSLESTEIEKENAKQEYCIDISTLKQPLFS